MFYILLRKVNLSVPCMFCVECGKEEKIFKNGVCIDCYIKNTNFTKGPSVIDIYKCSKCSSYKHKNTWLIETFEEVLKRHIRDNFFFNNELKRINIKTDCNNRDKNISCNIGISGFLNDHKILEEHSILVREKNTVCDICTKQFGGYYEAILQIRANKRKMFIDEIKKFRLYVKDFVKNLQEKGNRGLFITDISEEQNGIDFFLSEKGPAYTIAKKIQEKFGGEIKQSSTNIGMKDSRQLFRITYLIRLPQYKKGDFICYKNSFYYVYSITRDRVHVFDLSNWTEKILGEKEIQKANIFGGKELIKKMILVSQSNEEVQVMDPKSFKTFDVKKPKIITFYSKTLNIIRLKDEIFILLEKNTIDKKH